jgi:hypothetical protein
MKKGNWRGRSEEASCAALIDDGDDAAGRSVAGGGESRTSLEAGAVRLVTPSPAEPGKKTIGLRGTMGLRVLGSPVTRLWYGGFFAGDRAGRLEGCSLGAADRRRWKFG